MIKMDRLGIVLKPAGDKDSVFAKFNAGMVEDQGVVHMLYRGARTSTRIRCTCAMAPPTNTSLWRRSAYRN